MGNAKCFETRWPLRSLAPRPRLAGKTQLLYSRMKTLGRIREAVGLSGAEATEECIAAPTPEDRWFTPERGWPSSPSSELPAALTSGGYRPKAWEPPPSLVAPEYFGHVSQAIGEVRVEVLQAERLPRLLHLVDLDIVDPYAVLVFEGFAARTSMIVNDSSPRWSAEVPRAFRFPVTVSSSGPATTTMLSDLSSTRTPTFWFSPSTYLLPRLTRLRLATLVYHSRPASLPASCRSAPFPASTLRSWTRIRALMTTRLDEHALTSAR